MTDERPWWDEWGCDFQCEVCGHTFRRYHPNRQDSTGGYDCPECGSLAPQLGTSGPMLLRDQMSARAR